MCNNPLPHPLPPKIPTTIKTQIFFSKDRHHFSDYFSLIWTQTKTGSHYIHTWKDMHHTHTHTHTNTHTHTHARTNAHTHTHTHIHTHTHAYMRTRMCTHTHTHTHQYTHTHRLLYGILALRKVDLALPLKNDKTHMNHFCQSTWFSFYEKLNTFITLQKVGVFCCCLFCIDLFCFISMIQRLCQYRTHKALHIFISDSQ